MSMSSKEGLGFDYNDHGKFKITYLKNFIGKRQEESNNKGTIAACDEHLSSLFSSMNIY